MTRPDFAVTGLEQLHDRDLRFLLANFPEPGRSYEEMSRVIHEMPTTVESMLNSGYVLEKILRERQILLDVSPFLLFSVLLRTLMPDRRQPGERAVINYLANLLSIFVRSDRVHSLQPRELERYEYMVDLLEESERGDGRRRFLVQSHIGNYSLYLTGLFAGWLEHRRRYGKSTVDPSYYADLGRSYFHEAALHPLAREYRLRDVFLRLALAFDHYRGTLESLSRRYLRR